MCDAAIVLRCGASLLRGVTYTALLVGRTYPLPPHHYVPRLPSSILQTNLEPLVLQKSTSSQDLENSSPDALRQ